MTQPTLPVPDAEGVYTFPTDLASAHDAYQRELDHDRSRGPTPTLEVIAPYGGRRYLLPQRRASGRRLVVLEPHHDDLALSASGLLLSQPRPLTVITVFTRSTSAHSLVRAQHPGEDAISRLRADEARQALKPMQATHRMLGYRDARPPYGPYDSAVLKQVTTEIERVLTEIGGEDAELFAPAAVTRHPDHLLVHEAARRLGCRWFWEDAAFWQTYALSADDRHLFESRVGNTLTPELADITDAVMDKLTLLHLHGSQLQPVHAMYRPLRYAWTTAAPLRAETGDPRRFAERFYRLETP